MMPHILAKFECMWGRLKLATFQQITGYNLKMVQIKCTFSIKVEQEVIGALSSRYVADDLR